MQLSDSQILRQRKGEVRDSEDLVCLLTPLHPERALSRALVQHIGQEMPDISFTLEDAEIVSAVWVCGYEAGSADVVARLRKRHPEATLLVTGRDEPQSWREEVLAAGADHACGWPVPFEELSRFLHERSR